MKLKQFSMLSVIAGVFLVGSMAQASNYAIDPTHSNVGFTVRHMMSKVYGEFTKYEAKLDLDEKKPENSKVSFTVNTASIDTKLAKRDDHLRAADFFDTEKYPNMSFVGKKVKSKGNNEYTIEGDLTIKKVKKTVSFDVEFLGKDKDPWGGTRVGFVAKSKINRKDFGLEWNKVLESGGLLVGEEVEITLNIEAVESVPAAKK